MQATRSPFASRSVLRHLARGIAAFSALAGSAVLTRESTGPAIAGAISSAVLALILLRGCPMCWVVGLVETVSATRQRRPRRAKEGACP